MGLTRVAVGKAIEVGPLTRRLPPQPLPKPSSTLASHTRSPRLVFSVELRQCYHTSFCYENALQFFSPYVDAGMYAGFSVLQGFSLWPAL